VSFHVEHSAVCDCCGREGCIASNGNAGRREMKAAGWRTVTVRVGDRVALAHVCRECLRDDADWFAVTRLIERKMRLASQLEPESVGGAE
jgi:hypothetical protein